MSLIRLFEAPLLLKELSELAARKRTYVIRFLYALALFATGLFVLFGRAATRDVMLGHGQALFSTLVQLQQVAIMLLVPAMATSALTLEKERETLPLLLLTRISAAEIILEKFLSRVVPVLSYVMLSFPLMAVAYSYGGVTTFDLGAACLMLILAVLYEAAFALMCSSWFRTTVEAFIAVYFGQALLWFVTAGFVPIGALTSGSSWDRIAPYPVISLALRMLLLMVVYLVVAMSVLHRRAFVSPRNVLLQLFQALDRMFNQWNSVTGGVVLVRDGEPLPRERPVAWRETAKRSLGTFRYLVRVLVVIEMPILLVSQMVNIEMIAGHQAMTTLLYTLWIAAGAMVCLHASNVVSSERSRQTLDVLLATPIRGRDLLLEKLAGVRRLLWVLTIPFATIVLFQHWYRDYKWDLSYVAQQAALTVILGWTLSWLAFRVGLATRSAVAAMFTSFGVALAICGVPILLSFAARSFLPRSIATELVALLSLNPVTLIRMVESPTALDERAAQGWPPGLYLWGFGVAMLGYLGLGMLIRRRCLRNADRLLGRSWTEPSIDKSSTATDVATSPEANEQSLSAEIHMEPL